MPKKIMVNLFLFFENFQIVQKKLNLHRKINHLR